MLQYIRYTFGTFQQRKMRSVLTMVGIFIGIALIVTLISLGQGLQSSITQQFQNMGTDKIIISPTGSLFGVGQSGITLTDKDVDTVKKTPGIETVTGMSYKLAKVKYKDETKYTWVIGLPTDESGKMIFGIQNFKIVEGRDFQTSDKYAALIGLRLYEQDLFSKAVSLRDKIEIEGQEFRVVGEIGKIGNPQDDSQVYIPLDVLTSILGGEKKYDIIFAQVSDESRVDEIANSVKKELRKERNVEEGEEDFTVQTVSQLVDA